MPIEIVLPDEHDAVSERTSLRLDCRIVVHMKFDPEPRGEFSWFRLLAALFYPASLMDLAVDDSAGRDSAPREPLDQFPFSPQGFGVNPDVMAMFNQGLEKGMGTRP